MQLNQKEITAGIYRLYTGVSCPKMLTNLLQKWMS